MLETTLIYGITFCISIVFCRIYEKTKENNKNLKNILLLFAVFMPLIVISTLRYEVGTDYNTYLKYYRMIRDNFSIKYILGFFSKEPLYVIVSYLGYLLDASSFAVGANLLFTCIYLFFVFKGISYFKDRISITTAFFIFLTSYFLVYFNIMRQMIACAILLYSFKYIFEKKPIKYVFWVIIAGMFHKTAYIFVLLYLLNYKLTDKKINKLYYCVIAFSPILIIPLQKIIVVLSNTFGIYSEYANETGTLNLNFLLYMLPILILISVKRHRILEIDKRYELLIRIIFMQIPFRFLGMFISVADRLSIYVAFFQILLIPVILKTRDGLTDEDIENLKNTKILQKINNEKFQKIFIDINMLINKKEVLQVLIYFWYIFYFLMMFTVLNGHNVYPYKTIYSILR